MRCQLRPQNFGRELKGKSDVFARGQPSDRGAVFSCGLRDQHDLVVRQRLESLTQFPLQANGAVPAPGLERVRRKNAVPGAVPVTCREIALRNDSRQLRTQGSSGKTQIVTNWSVDWRHRGVPMI